MPNEPADDVFASQARATIREEVAFWFGRETTPGPASPPTKTYRVLTSGQESCEICGEAVDRRRMHYVGCDEDGCGLYICGAAHQATQEA